MRVALSHFPDARTKRIKGRVGRFGSTSVCDLVKERDAARRRIADMAVEFQLSPRTVLRDVEAAHRKALPPVPVLRPPKVELPLRRPGAPFHVAVKYRNPATGDYWKGRGAHPRWLREAPSAGRQLYPAIKSRKRLAPSSSMPQLRPNHDGTRRRRPLSDSQPAPKAGRSKLSIYRLRLDCETTLPAKVRVAEEDRGLSKARDVRSSVRTPV